MAYLHEKVLAKKGEEFIEMIREDGFDGEITMIRDYFAGILVKKNDEKAGRVIIDYKASKKTFSIRTKEVKDEKTRQRIEFLWNRKLGYILPEDGVTAAYVDGSYLNGSVGYGAVIIKDGNVIKEISGRADDEMFTGSRQVGGEILAVIETVKWCIDEKINEISIYYDFANLEKWYDGTYSANTPMSIYYRDFLRNSTVKLNFVKVIAHTKVLYNEKADELAKAGTLLKPLKDLAVDFASFIEDKGYLAEYLDIYNSQYAKVCIEYDGKTIGYVNIYNTLKINMEPKFNEIPDMNERSKIQKIWEDFIIQRGGI